MTAATAVADKAPRTRLSKSSLVVRAKSACAVRVAALLLLSAAMHVNIALAQSSVQLPTVRYGSIRGVAFDSLLLQPMVGVSVQLVGHSESTKTDDRGRFSFSRVPAGAQQVSLSSADLDSLGFGTIGKLVNVLEGKTASVIVSPLSLRSIWTRSCYAGNTFGTDSGVVWGRVQDAATGKAPVNAAVTFNWYDLRPGTLPGLMIRESQHTTATNADGIYFACGVPIRVAIGATGVTDSAASGRIEFELGERALQRLDLAVSSEMVVADSATDANEVDSLRVEPLRGSAGLRGRVLSDRDSPMRNALVGIVGADTVVRTDDKGEFRLRNLPAGTHNLSVRRIGQLPVMQTVVMHPNEISNVVVTMSSLPTLTTVNVRADVSKSKLRIEYEQRRKSALGYAIDGRIIEKRADMYSIFRDNPHMTVNQDGFGLSIVVRTPIRGRCAPAAFLDGFPVEMALASSLPTNLYRAVEVYENPYMVPAEYVTRASGLCGAILFWTKRISW